MKAIILAAGVASRLRPLTNNTPKCLLELGDKTILARTIDNLIDNSIKDFIIVTGFMREKIESFIMQNYPDLNVEFIHNDIFESTNNIYSLWLTKKSIIGSEAILLDSDIVFDSRIIGLLTNSGFDNCLAVKSGFELGAEEIKISLRNDQSIIEISKKVEPSNAAGESIGIEKFSPAFVNKLFNLLDQMILIEKHVNIFYEAAFQRLINSGELLFSVDVGGLKCLEIDFPEDLKTAIEEVELMK